MEKRKKKISRIYIGAGCITVLILLGVVIHGVKQFTAENADTKKAREARYKTPAFNPMDDKKFTSTVRKFYDSLHYIHLLGKNKPVKYVYVVEAPNSDAIMRKRLRVRMKTLLPFALQENINTGISLIDKVDVLSINEWNMHDEYGKYPLVKL